MTMHTFECTVLATKAFSHGHYNEHVAQSTRLVLMTQIVMTESFEGDVYVNYETMHHGQIRKDIDITTDEEVIVLCS